MRKPFVAGNWKMFTNASSARNLAAEVVKRVAGEERVRVAVCPPFPYLQAVADIVRGTPVALGAQNLYPEKEGAFTGEVSPTMLVDVGCRHVIVGHSERRHKLREDDAFINRKVKAVLAAGLSPIFCVGETEGEREANRTESVLDRQVSAGLAGLTSSDLVGLVIAYEPVWAIGTGKNATPEQAQQAHVFIRGKIGRMHGEEWARELPIQYGGSVKPENAAALLGQADVDGALVGGASLVAEQFLAIVQAALP